MGLDDFSSGDDSDNSSDDNWEENWNGDDSQSNEFPPKGAIANIIKEHAEQDTIDVSVNGSELSGNAEEFAMLFGLMCLDYPDSDPYNLITADEV